MSPLDIVIVVVAFVVIVVGAELFTNGVEWLGVRLGMSEGATGSILAAFGTATPETMIPIIAIVFTNTPDADEIGVGAILGAPFMLGTLVMLLIGATAFFMRKRRGRDTLHVDTPHALRDMSFFLVMYGLAVALALLPPPLHPVKAYVGWIFVPAYFLYLFLVLRTPKTTAVDVEEEAEGREAFDDLTFATYLARFGARVVPRDPALWLILLQVIVSFAAIVLGARLFAAFVEDVSQAFGLNALLVSLILAPLATELPEAANSLVWTRQGKDIIALGNVAGAMVFQSTIPVTVGVLLTAWDLGPSSAGWPFGLMTALFALLSGALIWVQLRTRAKDNALPLSALVLGGSLYVVFIAYTLWAVHTGGTSTLSLR